MRTKDNLTMIEAEVTAVGSGAHVIVPKSWLGKIVKVTVLKD